MLNRPTFGVHISVREVLVPKRKVYFFQSFGRKP